jgi:hypothetical protein
MALNLAYSPSLPPAIIAEMERSGKRLGLPLDALEGLGQNEVLCRSFVEAARRGEVARLQELANLASAPGPRQAVHRTASAA